MNKRTTVIMVFVLLCVICIAHALWYYPRLPEQVAHHFDTTGKPDAWGHKIQFLIVYLATIGIMALAFLGLGLLMPKIPDSAINLPNKNYWLAPERRQKTLNYMLPLFLWMGSFTMILLLDIFHQSFQVHLGNAAKLDHFWISIGAYLAITTAWCVIVYKKFSHKTDTLQMKDMVE